MDVNLTGVCLEEEVVPEEEDDVVFLERKKLIEWLAYRVIGPAVVAIGLLGNVLNLCVLTRPSLRGVTYAYLIGLASADLGVLLCAIPMMVRQTDFVPVSSWPVAFFYSKLEHPLANTFMGASIFIVICLTLDRFASVCLPTRFKALHTYANCRTAILSCYAVAVLISLPLTFLKQLVPCPANYTSQYHQYQDHDQEESRRYTFTENFPITNHVAWKAYLITGEIIVRFGPAAILGILNSAIILRFRLISKNKRRIMLPQQGGEGRGTDSAMNNTTTTTTTTGGSGGGGSDGLLLRGEKISKKIYAEEKRMFTLLSAIVILFLVTTTPAAFLSIFYSETLDKNLTFQVFRAVANCLELCNFALNFYIYFLCSKPFRKKFLSFFTPLLPRKGREVPNNNGGGGGGGTAGTAAAIALPHMNPPPTHL